MKIKNKKTGEIIDDISNITENYDSLVELTEEWEDYSELDYVYYIGDEGSIIPERRGSQIEEYRKRIGNYYETKEEAQLAVDKLKAMKRLRDGGLKFTGYKNKKVNVEFGNALECDLELIFGGEE